MAQTNKFVLSIFALITFISSAQGACDQVVCASVVKAEKICTDVLVVKNGCGACHNISAKDFMDAEGNLSQTVVIDQPGRWCLCENINFNPAPDAAFQPAIQILASNVHLDLGEYTLRQVNKDVLDIYGVQIGEGYLITDPELHFDNITITNGSINGFSAIGIHCYNPTYDFLDVPFAFNSFIFTNLNILNNGIFPNVNDNGAGIQLTSAAPSVLQEINVPVTYNNVIIDNCKVNRCLGTASIFIYTVDNLVINNTQANDYYTEVYPAFGISAAFYIIGRNIQMFNCQGNGVTDLTPEGAGQCGSFIEMSFNVYLKDCQFNDTYGESNSIINFNPSNCHDFVAENCQFNNNRGGDNAVIVCGVHMSDGGGQTFNANGMKFINCQFNGARVSDISPGIFSGAFVSGTVLITLNNVVFENCQSCNNVSNNPNFATYGLFVAQLAEDPAFPFADVHNISFKNCVISDISGISEIIGLSLGNANQNTSGNQGLRSNCVIDNCIIERIQSSSENQRVAGIAEYTVPFFGPVDVFPLLKNLYVNNCRISDVRSTATPLPSFLSAGILVESVVNPVLSCNNVSDCDRGILLTGTNQIIPNGFQLAATLEDALAFPPVSVPLNVSVKVFTNPELPGAPFDAVLAEYSPSLASTTGLGAITIPLNACGSVVNDLTNQIGICRRGACIFPEKTANIEAQGGVGTIVIQNPGEVPFAMSGAPTGNYPSVMISFEDGTTLMDAINDGQAIELTIDSIPTSLAVQTFVNLNKANEVLVTPADVDSKGFNFIYSPVDLNSLNWQSGDPIFYDCNGFDAIPDLVCSTTYYAIVYSPGFARNGVIQDNEVDNCSESGYQDDAPTTSSAWVNNFAFNNGPPASAPANYSITWTGTAPVYEGDLAEYPTGSAKAYNISLIP